VDVEQDRIGPHPRRLGQRGRSAGRLPHDAVAAPLEQLPHSLLVGDLRPRGAERNEANDLALARRRLHVRRFGSRLAPEARSPARGAERHEQDEVPVRHVLHVAPH
jgi:hypothetical protein